ncbi:hypothetical protein [Streptomyces beijiangensis]|uniref:Secreted protein n=1 Tax=Streptomyces beijiangensis TaxID=163361 RepID=A0A939F5B3_9ACTN|nr:hypothetical protein [Streptomyces beijiangensis]MBO0512332.1 hypothetical protein [Streptomyces beijiangensis]
MQPSALPDLAHTRTRPVHWLATAAAMAAVVAGAGFLQPDAATASQAGPHTATAPGTTGAVFPLKCDGAKTTVVKKASGDLDGDGSPETVAVVRCAAGSGTPPSGIYVLTRPASEGGAPRIVATLLDPEIEQSVTDFAVLDGEVTATLLGYSTAAVPRCCPDVQEKAKWRWQGGKFLRSAQAEAQSM